MTLTTWYTGWRARRRATADLRRMTRHVRTQHRDACEVAAKFGVPLDLLATLHDTWRLDGQCPGWEDARWDMTCVHKRLRAINYWMGGGGKPATLIAILTEAEPYAHFDSENEVASQFLRAAHQWHPPHEEWETTRDWSEEFLAYIRQGYGFGDTARMIEHRVPRHLCEHVRGFDAQDRWRHALSIAYQHDIAPDLLAPFLTEPDLGDWHRMWVVGKWLRDFTPDQVRLFLEAGLRSGEPYAPDFDMEAVRAVAAFR